MSRPGVLEIAVGMAAYAQGEPNTVLNGVEVECLTNPSLARRRATNRKNARDILSFFVGRRSRLPVITLHRHPHTAPADRCGNEREQLIQLFNPGNIDSLDKTRVKMVLMEPSLDRVRAAF